MALASKRDSSSMKTIAILGIVFLPGTFIAVRRFPRPIFPADGDSKKTLQSILSTTLFDFHDATTLASAVSPRFGIDWAITFPVTLFILSVWYLWERKRIRMNEEEENEKDEPRETLSLAFTLRRARPLRDDEWGGGLVTWL
ncbi:hypothetical protein NHQ30_002012 [Ciborinia camelliae]|nr:hypothetical protein NHQ30_002012 [Ciborinia camelliae]